MPHTDHDLLALSSLMDGELDEAGRNEVMHHLRFCAQCRDALEEMEAAQDHLALVGVGAPVPHRVTARVQDEIEARATSLAPRRLRWQRAIPTGLGTALAALVVFIGAGLMNHSGGQGAPVQSQASPPPATQSSAQGVVLKSWGVYARVPKRPVHHSQKHAKPSKPVQVVRNKPPVSAELNS